MPLFGTITSADPILVSTLPENYSLIYCYIEGRDQQNIFFRTACQSTLLRHTRITEKTGNVTKSKHMFIVCGSHSYSTARIGTVF